MKNKIQVLIFLLATFLITSNLFGKERYLLSKAYPPEKLKQILISPEKWHPFPTIQERKQWQNISPEIQNYLIKRGENGLNFEWPALPATLFLEFARNGNRSNYQNVRNERRNTLSDLVIAECVEGKERFLDDIVNGIWVVCEETYWGVPAHLNIQKAGNGLPDVEEPTVDLFVGETANLLSWTYYLLGEKLDKVSPLVRPRIEREMKIRVLEPCLTRDDFWWMGFRGGIVNNWNPWCNSNWLTTIMVFEKDQHKRFVAFEKIVRSLDKFIDVYHDDGGCDEGPGYWGRAGASLFECLELLYSATDGKFNVYDNPLIQEIGKYIYRAHINGDYFVNFADAAAIVNVAGDIVYRYGKRIDDDQLTAFGAFSAFKRKQSDFGINSSLGRQLPAIFGAKDLFETKPVQPLLRDVWMKDLQFMTARSEAGSEQGLFVAAKGGHNDESHNHNDIGNFIVYLDGRPMIIDVGVETYTKKTFSSQRYEIWTMQSAFHNLPTIDGVMQEPGRKYEAQNVKYKSTDKLAEMELDISSSYPAKTNLKSWQRTIRLNRGKNLKIKDSFQLKNSTNNLNTSLMTPCDVSINQNKIELKDKKTGRILFVEFKSKKMIAEVEEIKLEDTRLKSVWGEKIYRILLKVKSSVKKDTWEFVIKS